jgi:hypothetical protein
MRETLRFDILLFAHLISPACLCSIHGAILILIMTVVHASASLHAYFLPPPDFWRYIPGTVAGLAAGTWSKVPLRCGRGYRLQSGQWLHFYHSFSPPFAHHMTHLPRFN